MKSFSEFLVIYATLAMCNDAYSLGIGGLENLMKGNFKNDLDMFQFLMKNGKDFIEMAKWFTTNATTLPLALDHMLDSHSAFPENISKVCETHVRYAIKTFLETTKKKIDPVSEWSMQMFDSLPKPSSGIFNGNLFWLGSFWECIGVSTGHQDANDSQAEQRKNISSTDIYFRGEYCIVSLKFNLPAELRLGLCLPDSCTYEDKSQLVTHWLRNTHVKSELDKTFCQTSNRQEMDTTAKIITGCLMGIIFLVLVGTLLDCMNYKGRMKKFFVNLSMTRNLRQIFDMDMIEGEIQVLHGIRCFTLAWIVLGHCYDWVLLSATDNLMAVKTTIENDIWFGIILNMTLSVDTFFMISSMLVTYTFLKKMQTFDSCDFHIMYLSRYIRLTPALMTTVAILAGPFYCLKSGPVWPYVYQYKSSCRESWWSFLTYVLNLLPTMPSCFGPGWYLAVDMQMFLVTPFLLYPLYKKPKWGLVGIVICLVLTVVCQMLVVYYNEVEILLTSDYSDEKMQHFYKYFYMKPWGHFGQYLVGMILGYILHVHFKRREIVIRPVEVIIGWAVSFIVMASVVFGTYPIASGQLKATPVFNMLYGPLSRQAWTFSVAWMVLACVTGNGGAVDSILSCKYFKPLSRISYCSYLIHHMILIGYFASMSQTGYFDHYSMAYIFLGSMIATVFLGLALCVLFEMPLVSLLNDLVFGKNKKKPKAAGGDRQLLLEQEDPQILK